MKNKFDKQRRSSYNLVAFDKEAFIEEALFHFERSKKNKHFFVLKNITDNSVR